MILRVIVPLAVISLCQGLPTFIQFENTPENIARLRNLKPDELAEELSGQIEGDMILTVEQYRDMYRRNGLVEERYRWPDNVVHYEIEEEYFNADQIEHILTGMRQIELVSCVKFRRRAPGQEDYIRIHGSGSGCSATVGHVGGQQNINLQPAAVNSGCFRLGTIVHELIHGIGFRHMQSAHDRDEWVQIVWDNIQPGRENNFRLYGPEVVSHFGTDYDYGSVMHYSSTAFSINGEKTIVPLRETDKVMGQRNGMSEIDIVKINRMYKCLEKN
ncbi:zinc metalloproteinase nas-4-like [Uranotaenia lowii]|uniref:zinc metalloproteinase nas-4-like n=1 Tax=Uranotaenia lowii TaxID=190385 RepID=UPI00247AB6EA|nr:zinc metalloproteinase nas-4-like [Uranotaenia lowii]